MEYTTALTISELKRIIADMEKNKNTAIVLKGRILKESEEHIILDFDTIL